MVKLLLWNIPCSPFQVFQTKDGYITIALADGRKEKWPLLCSLIDRVDLIDDPRFKDGWTRSQNWDILEPLLSQEIVKKSSVEWLNDMQDMGIPCGPVNTIDKVVEDPQIKHRGMVTTVPHPRLGSMKLIDTPLKFSRSDTGARKSSPDLGQDTYQILNNWLGLTDPEIDHLREEQVI